MMRDLPPHPYAQFIIGGHTYRWFGWWGSQLESNEWFVVPAGTIRTLDFGPNIDSIDVTVARSTRHWFKVQTNWAVSDRGTWDEHLARIQQLRNSLARLI